MGERDGGRGERREGEGGQELQEWRQTDGGETVTYSCCLQVISPSSEHLFQTLNEQDLHFWTDALQKTTAEALQKFETSPQALSAQQNGGGEGGGEGGGTTDIVPDAMVLILVVPGNRQCADCTSTGERGRRIREEGEGRGELILETY